MFGRSVLAGANICSDNLAIIMENYTDQNDIKPNQSTDMQKYKARYSPPVNGKSAW